MIRLIITLHGVGSSAADLAQAAADLASRAGVEALSLDGPERFDMAATGRQWFSVRRVTEETRPARVAAALPALLARLDEERGKRGLKRDEVAVVGFSQGAIMTLALLAGGAGFGCFVAIAGRLAAPVVPARGIPPSVALIHDKMDTVMPIALAMQAADTLRSAGHGVRLTITEGYGHAIGPLTIEAATAQIIQSPANQEI